VGYEFLGGIRTVDVHMRRWRAKLGTEHDQMIGTVRNVDYKYVGTKSRRPGDGCRARGDRRRDRPREAADA
jgi:hypothetical protein